MPILATSLPDGRLKRNATDQAILDQTGLELLHQMRPRVADRALVDNMRDKKDRTLEGEVVKKDDDDGRSLFA